MTSDRHASDVAAKYSAAVDAGDDQTLLACYAPGARIWHNTDRREQTPEQNIALGTWLRHAIPDLTFAEVRTIPTASGFLRLSVMRGTAPDGSALVAPSCIVGFLDGQGRIERIEEYLDPAPFNVLKTARRPGDQVTDSAST